MLEHKEHTAVPIRLTPYQRRLVSYWLPALVGGAIAWIVFVRVGQTPLLRASGLALAIVGVILALRSMGTPLAITGGLALAFSPAFWIQTGGGQTPPAAIVLALGAAIILGALIVALSRRPYVALMIALGVFVAVFVTLFFSQIGVARSLRLTIFTGAWLIYMLVNAVMETNPRPDGPPRALLSAQYRAGLLLLYGLGVVNDPLFMLFAPALILGLVLSQTRIPLWYWAFLVMFTALGVFGLLTQYYDPAWWRASAERLMLYNRTPPFLVASAWGTPTRWLDLFTLIAQQFTPLGLILGLIGMSRLSRWYPVLGGVMMLAFGSFFLFGLFYFGADRPILLLPMFMILIIWITYAVYTFSQWIEKYFASHQMSEKALLALRWIAPVVYLALPVWLFLTILKVV